MEDLIRLSPRRAPSRDLALFDKGFRPHFLLAAVFGIVGVPVWILARSGWVGLGDHLLPSVWHGHEMVFGFAGAVIGGFLLTAASNWTGRVTAVGAPLALLCAVWIAGRVAVLLGGVLPGPVIAGLALAYLPLLALAVGRPILATRRRRNYGILAVLAALFAAQALTHAGALRGAVGLQTLGPRLGVGIVVILVLVIGGRIIPLFTRNATGADVVTHRGLDLASIAFAVIVVLLDAFSVHGVPLALAAGGAAVTTAARARGWGARHARREPLLWVLHAGWAFVPIGFGLRAVAALTPRVGASAALHALTVGAIGVLVLGMMARVTLGHTGRPLRAGRALGTAFGLLVLAAVVRVVGPLVGGAAVTSALHLSATLWSIALAIYLARAAPMLLARRPDGRPG